MSKLASKATCIAISAIIFLLLGSFAQAQNLPINEQPFTNKTIVDVKQKYSGERWLMVLWSLDCPACFKELKLIENLQQENRTKPLNVIFINVDDSVDVTAERLRILREFGMVAFTHFYFTDGQADRNRYQIDPQWYGELPRSYFVNEKGEFYGKSGLLDEALIKTWLLEESL
jgi:thiol-disulfide isomerase/thioredoxin